MIVDNIISITDLRKKATTLIEHIKECIIVVHNTPKAALISIDQYKKFKRLEKYESLIESALLLNSNSALDFLKDEPDYYEDY